MIETTPAQADKPPNTRTITPVLTSCLTRVTVTRDNTNQEIDLILKFLVMTSSGSLLSVLNMIINVVTGIMLKAR